MHVTILQTTSIKNIEDRLLGNFPKAKGLPLSIEGQVHSLIQVYNYDERLSDSVNNIFHITLGGNRY